MSKEQPAIRLNLEELLEEKQLTRYELAKRTGVKYQTIDNYYKNKVIRYDTDVLLKICLALDCGVEDVIKMV